jgi:hypothetical protein
MHDIGVTTEVEEADDPITDEALESMAVRGAQDGATVAPGGIPATGACCGWATAICTLPHPFCS